MIAAGIVGGTVNTARVALTGGKGFDRPAWKWHILFGVAAALLMPLFLNTIKSELFTGILKTGKVEVENLFIFAGFCLLAAIAGRSFIENLTEKVVKGLQKDIDKANKEAREARTKSEAATEGAENAKKIALKGSEGLLQKEKELSQAKPLKRKRMPGIQKPTTPPKFEEIKPGKEIDDPWNGQFANNSANNQRILEASIKPLDEKGDWCEVTLTVRSTDPVGAPLKGWVQFYLHPTFTNHKPIVPVTEERGVAELTVLAWGAFTVGAIADPDRRPPTLLELDLSEVKEAPKLWASR